MTIAEIAAQMGVTPETLVQEVIAKHVTGGILLTALYVVLMLGAIVATVKLMRNVEYCAILRRLPLWALLLHCLAL